jgi:hypothetical protein
MKKLMVLFVLSVVLLGFCGSAMAGRRIGFVRAPEGSKLTGMADHECYPPKSHDILDDIIIITGSSDVSKNVDPLESGTYTNGGTPKPNISINRHLPKK